MKRSTLAFFLGLLVIGSKAFAESACNPPPNLELELLLEQQKSFKLDERSPPANGETKTSPDRGSPRDDEPVEVDETTTSARASGSPEKKRTFPDPKFQLSVVTFTFKHGSKQLDAEIVNNLYNELGKKSPRIHYIWIKSYTDRSGGYKINKKMAYKRSILVYDLVRKSNISNDIVCIDVFGSDWSGYGFVQIGLPPDIQRRVSVVIYRDLN